jgi:ATP-binding cassette, subfamily B, bacterial
MTRAATIRRPVVAGLLDGERRMIHLANYRARWYWVGTACWIMWFATPLLPGWLTAKVFDELQTRGVTGHFWGLASLLLGVQAAAAMLIHAGHRIYIQGVEASKNAMRVNAVAGQLASGGPSAAPRTVPVGDAVSRLRDDPFDVLFLLDNWVDLAGSLIYGIIASIVLIRIDPVAGIAGIAPMLIVGLLNSRVGAYARRFRGRSRAASSAVGDFLNSAFEASLTVKVAGAQPAVLRRLRELNDRRAHSQARDGIWNELVWTLNSAMADIFVGVALLVAARRSMTTGEITLFAAYLVNLVWLPMRIGGTVVGRRRYEVSAGRLDALVAPCEPGAVDRLTEHRIMPVLGGRPVVPSSPPSRQRLERLEVRGLTVKARGLVGIDLTISRGDLVVVSGAVGVGKTSLLRAVIGLTEIDEGEVLWNGSPVGDRAAFFVPPQCAYVAQVPRLFADSLVNNLRLGYDLSQDDVLAAVSLAAFDDDASGFPRGLETLVGTRGVRLSGGQAQRAAAARALVHRPELLVLDDLTSALDVETELELWSRLAAAGMTVLAASNRPAALARADFVLEL